jgi:hypothetical protein
MTYVSGLVVLTVRSEAVPLSSRPNTKALCSMEWQVTTTGLRNVHVCTYSNLIYKDKCLFVCMELI